MLLGDAALPAPYEENTCCASCVLHFLAALAILINGRRLGTIKIMPLAVSFHTMIATILLALSFSGDAATIRPATDASTFAYEGRWANAANSAKSADWPCASAHFRVNVTSAASCSLEAIWSGVRTRVVIKSFIAGSSAAANEHIFDGPGFTILKPRVEKSVVTFSKEGVYDVMVRKLTDGAPYAMGIGSEFLSASVLTFMGASIASQDACSFVAPPAIKKRAIDFYGASDTAGYCVDGDTKMGPIAYGVEGWKYSNCDYAAAGDMGRGMNAALSVQGYPGVGLTQNANSKEQWIMGKLTMAGLYNRTLQTLKSPLGDSPSNKYDLADEHKQAGASRAVLISLGGNDYNHQKGHVPSNVTFTAAYVNFLSALFEAYGYTGKSSDPGLAPPVLISVCGQGSPQEAKEDPDNNRCRPCPHVEAAVKMFKSTVEESTGGKLRAEYIFVPCDGTVVTGSNDIGCNGHKNRAGQGEVAAFLEPKVNAIMGWS